MEYSAQPKADLSLKIDAVTGKYIDYKEHTPGSLLVAPCDLLERRVGEVVPEVAEVIERGIWFAKKHDRVERIAYTLRNRARRAYITVRGQQVMIDINAVIG